MPLRTPRGWQRWKRCPVDARLRLRSTKPPRARREQLAAAEDQYAKECAAREQAVVDQNKALDGAHRGFGVSRSRCRAGVCQRSCSLTRSNPLGFPITHSRRPSIQTTAELTMRVLIPGPDKVPADQDLQVHKSPPTRSPQLPQPRRTPRTVTTGHRAQRCAANASRSVRGRPAGPHKEQSPWNSAPRQTDPATGQPTYVPFVAAGHSSRGALRRD